MPRGHQSSRARHRGDWNQLQSQVQIGALEIQYVLSKMSVKTTLATH